MTRLPSEPADDARPQVWFPDTSALVTLAVHQPLQRAVVATLSTHDLVLVESVVAELEGLAGTSDAAAVWAGTALGQLDWIGPPVRVDDPAGTQLAVELQELIAGARCSHVSTCAHLMPNYAALCSSKSVPYTSGGQLGAMSTNRL